ncbi:hypothetical protein ACFLZX_04190 [Nanoarchaeota archaeon]
MSDLTVPVYVKVDDYKEVVEVLGAIKTKLNDAKNTLDKLKELKEREDSELQSWEAALADAEAKVNEVDSVIESH